MDATASSALPDVMNKIKAGGMSGDLVKLGNNLVTKFHVMMRVSQIYDAKNVTFRQFMQESLETINALVEKERGICLKVVKDDFFLNDQRLRYSVDGFTSFKYVTTHWKKKMIGGVTIREQIDERMLQEFVYTMNGLRTVSRKMPTDLMNG